VKEKDSKKINRSERINLLFAKNFTSQDIADKNNYVTIINYDHIVK